MNRKENRKTMPNVADIIDNFKDVFESVRVLACEDKETGVKAGRFEEFFPEPPEAA